MDNHTGDVLVIGAGIAGRPLAALVTRSGPGPLAAVMPLCDPLRFAWRTTS